MAVELEIEDGNPDWYLSEHVWVVPGDDPEGAPGLPIAGANAYLWARVRNNGSSSVSNATVKFYWANPSVGFDRNTATPIGTSVVTLDAGQSSEVLCLTPWVPVYVNDGHECVLAEAFHTSDPLPAGAAFNVPIDRHVAQRNLSVVLAARLGFRFAFEVHNTSRVARTFTVKAAQAELGTIKHLLPLLGKDFALPNEEGRATDLGFVSSPCPTPEEIDKRVPELESLKMNANGRVGFTLVGALDRGAALVKVEQMEGDRVVGGLGLLVVRAKEN